MKRPWWRSELAADVMWAAAMAGSVALAVLLNKVDWGDRWVLSAFVRAFLWVFGKDVLAWHVREWVRSGAV